MIAFDLGDDVDLLAAAAAKLAPKLREAARAAERERQVPPALKAAYAEQGLGLVELPESAGGAGLGLLPAAVVTEALSVGDAALALAMPQPGAFGRLVRLVGNEAQKHEWLAAFSEKPTAAQGAVAFSEAHTPPGRVDTRAVKQGGQWLISGRKDFVLHSVVATRVAVLAQVEEGNGLRGAGVFALPTKTAGIRVLPSETWVGLEVVQGGSIEFHDVRAPLQARLGEGDLSAQLDRFFAEEGLLHAARAVGLAEAAYSYALAYAGERKAFGKPIAHFQSIAFLLSDMLMQVEASRWLLRHAAWAADHAHPDAVSLLHAARAQADEAAFFVTDNAVQILGGHGYIQDHPVEKWMRDAKALALVGGSLESADLRSAAHLLGEPWRDDLLPVDLLQPVWT